MVSFKTNIVILTVMIFLGMAPGGLVSAKDGDQTVEKRRQIREAIAKEVLTVYDIPFNVYVNLGMWDEIDGILKANNKNIARYHLPGMYYSRPYIIRDQIWAFQNTDPGDIYVFDPESLNLLKILKNDQFSQYAGGIRAVHKNYIISGGSDRDVDMAVIWNFEDDVIRTVKLSDGHYIGAIAVENERLYIGSCGGMVNAWDLRDLKWIGSYAASPVENTDWEVFNQKECITGLHFFDDQVIGAGEKHLFFWDIQNRTLMKTLEKTLSHSIVYFHEEFFIENKEFKSVIRSIKDGRAINELTTEKPVDDLIVTSEKVLADQPGPVLIMAMRYNQGLMFYNFNTLTPLGEIALKGDTLTVYKNMIFATDDRDIYQYDFHRWQPEKYRSFLKTLKPDELPITGEGYAETLKRARQYPQVMDPEVLAQRVLKSIGLEFNRVFKYGTIGERVIQEDGGTRHEEPVYGYRLLYEVKNQSQDGYALTLSFAWSGKYGNEDSEKDSLWKSHTEALFVPPRDGRVMDGFDVGEKEPVNFYIFVEKVEKMPETYYNDLMMAISSENQDAALVEKYLKDERARQWHPALETRKNEMTASDKSGFWLFR
jgi:hypothetical protein